MKQLSNFQVLLLAFASAVVVANAYYLHPIISLIADEFGLSDGMVGIIPAFNQIALAVGILLLLPLGDRLSNRLLTVVTVLAQLACVIIMAWAQRFEVFLIASTVLGFVTIAPYLLPAYVSKRVPADRLGFVMAVLTTGIILGILVSRGGSGVIAEHFGWRTVYVIAAILMLGISILLPFVMEPPAPDKEQSRQRYASLIASVFRLTIAHRGILVSGIIQALNFGIFISVWMGIGLHLPSEQMGYGVDMVGYLALLAAINLFATPVLGAWADRTGAYKARAILGIIQFLGVSLLLVTGHSLWLMVIPIILMNLTGPAIDVTGRMTFLSEPEEIRTRLMTIFIVLMFIGGGLASWAGTASYAAGGWTGNALVAVSMSSLACLLSFWRWRLEPTAVDGENR
ncbi:MAG: MFS transporter [Pseudomonadota bacterium]